MARILVVDDDEVIVRLLELNFELEGHEVRKATDGGSAMAQVAADSPDLVVLDIMMPDVDGYEVCRRLRDDPTTQELPVVFLSARALDDDIARGTAAGGDAYVTKPFDPLALVELVERLLAQRASPGGGPRP